jgi:hypothetical protein
MNSEYKVGLRLISLSIFEIGCLEYSHGYIHGYIHEMKKFHPKGEWHIIIDWNDFGKVQYTKTMLDESFSEGNIQIDKQFYRDIKLHELGIV